MKKKILPHLGKITLVLLLLMVIFLIYWYKPRTFVQFSLQEVDKIKIFSGYSGQNLVITEEEHINHLVENWNQVRLKRGESTKGRSGFTFATTVYGKDGNYAIGNSSFTINSDNTVAFDGYFWHPTDILLDYDYILNLFPPKE